MCFVAMGRTADVHLLAELLDGDGSLVDHHHLGALPHLLALALLAPPLLAVAHLQVCTTKLGRGGVSQGRREGGETRRP